MLCAARALVGSGGIHTRHLGFVDHEPASEGVRLGNVERHPPGIDAPHCRSIRVIGLNGVHAVPPLLRHQPKAANADGHNDRAPEDLLFALEPEEGTHGRYAQQGAA